MRAEVTVTFKKDLDNNTAAILARRLGSSSPIANCAHQTSLRDLSSVINEIQFAKQSTLSIRLYFRDDARVIKVHIEAASASTVASVKREIDDVINGMRSLCKDERGGSCAFRVVISSDESDLQVGSTIGYGSRLKRSLTSNFPVKIYIPLVTALATYFVGGSTSQIKQSVINALISIAAMLLWALIDAAFVQEWLQYKEA